MWRLRVLGARGSKAIGLEVSRFGGKGFKGSGLARLWVQGAKSSEG